jgi:hypothetical protein
VHVTVKVAQLTTADEQDVAISRLKVFTIAFEHLFRVVLQ